MRLWLILGRNCQLRKSIDIFGGCLRLLLTDPKKGLDYFLIHMETIMEDCRMCHKNIIIALFISMFILFTSQISFSSSKQYSIAEARAHFERLDNELINLQNKLDNDEIRDIDEAMGILKKYDWFDYELKIYMFRLPGKIIDSRNNKNKLKENCQDFSSIISQVEKYKKKYNILKKNITEKFIKKEMYTIPTEEDIHKATVSYLIESSKLYRFKDPDSIKIKIDETIPYKAESGLIGFIFYGHYNAKNGYGAYVGYEPVQLEYLDGKLTKFDTGGYLGDVTYEKFCNKN